MASGQLGTLIWYINKYKSVAILMAPQKMQLLFCSVDDIILLQMMPFYCASEIQSYLSAAPKLIHEGSKALHCEPHLQEQNNFPKGV